LTTVVLVVRRAKPSLRGRLTRWFLEVQAGVYVGSVSNRVREVVWEDVVSKLGAGEAVMVWTARTEQGFRLITAGDSRREVVDFDGLALIRVVRDVPF
jgi:CRISPR-associated protein Cas2